MPLHQQIPPTHVHRLPVPPTSNGTASGSRLGLSQFQLLKKNYFVFFCFHLSVFLVENCVGFLYLKKKILNFERQIIAKLSVKECFV